MEQESLSKALDVIYMHIQEADITLVDKLELLMNLREYLQDKEKYDYYTKMLVKNKFINEYMKR